MWIKDLFMVILRFFVPYRTIEIAMTYELRADWSPVVSTVERTLKAKFLWARRIKHEYDTTECQVEVIAGGKAGKAVATKKGTHRVVIKLDKPLWVGQTAKLSYKNIFQPGIQPPPELRCDVKSRFKRLSMTLQFSELPEHLFWAYWGRKYSQNARVLEEVEVARTATTLKHEATNPRRGVQGFYWVTPKKQS